MDDLLHEEDVPDRSLNNLNFIFHFQDFFLQRLYGPYLLRFLFYVRNKRIKDRKLAALATGSHPDSYLFCIPNPIAHTQVLSDPRKACHLLKIVLRARPEGVAVKEAQMILEDIVDAITPDWKLLGDLGSRFPD